VAAQLAACQEGLSSMSEKNIHYGEPNFSFQLIDHSKKIVLEVNAQKKKYMLLSRHHNAGKNHNIMLVTVLCECGTVQVFGNESNKSKFGSGGNYEETELR
jgi:hypothetical protein